jgi:hypothetical protein
VANIPLGWQEEGGVGVDGNGVRTGVGVGVGLTGVGVALNGVVCDGYRYFFVIFIPAWKGAPEVGDDGWRCADAGQAAGTLQRLPWVERTLEP